MDNGERMNNALTLLNEAEQEIVSRQNGKPSLDLAAGLVVAAQVALQQATEVDQVKDIRDKLNGVETYLKKQKVELVNSNLVVAQRMRTERALGWLIPEKFPVGNPQWSSRSTNVMDDYGISKFMSSRWQKIAEIDDQDFELYVQELIDKNEELTTAGLLRYFAMLHVSDDSYEWYTPSAYIEAAREVMGSIDLDPASCDDAQKIVKAGRHYTIDDDGLSQPWFGNVFLNPPYNMPAVQQFSERAIYEYEGGKIANAIVLVNNATDTGWFHRLLSYPVCFPQGRVQFWTVGKPNLGARQGQAFFYLGEDEGKFSKVFSDFGVVLKRCDDRE